MSFVEGLNHILNLLLPALGLALISTALVKLLWWRRLRAVPYLGLAAWATTAALAALLGGVAWTGRDGMMLTYGAMVLATALALWIAGFLLRR